MLRYLSFKQHLISQFGNPASKICIDAGFTCPNRDGTKGTGGCIYCNDLGSGAPYISRGKSVSEQIEAGRKLVGKRNKHSGFIVYFQAFSNTYAPVETLRALYWEALRHEDVIGLSIGTRPDCINDEILDLLAEISGQTYLWLEYGLETIHDKTLKKINRKHSFNDTLNAFQGARKRGINVCFHVIIGLPGETEQDILETARTVGELQPEGVKIHSLYIETGTKLHEMYERNPWKLFSKEEYCSIAASFLEHIHEDCVIHRLAGDAHPDRLAAPLWTRDKLDILQRINNTLASRDSRQGKFFGTNQ